MLCKEKFKLEMSLLLFHKNCGEVE